MDSLKAWFDLPPLEVVPELVRQYQAGTRAFPEFHADSPEATASFTTVSPLQDKRLDGLVLPGIDLRGINLGLASFVGCDLRNAIFTRATFSSCDFSRANLNGAAFNLTNSAGVKFDDASMRDAQLGGAFCDRFSFRGADLRGANLQICHFSNVDFENAMLDGAMIGHTAIANCDLEPLCRARLEHVGPTTVDFISIVRSRHVEGLNTFLVRTGMAEIAAIYLIDSARAVSSSLLEHFMRSAFISYGSPDEAFARRLNEDLLRNGVRTFLFAKDAVYGEPLHRTMFSGVNEHDRMILVCSEASLQRPGVLNEVEQALRREARLGGESLVIPVALDDFLFNRWKPERADLRQQLIDRVVADFSDESAYPDRLQRLLSALRKK